MGKISSEHSNKSFAKFVLLIVSIGFFFAGYYFIQSAHDSNETAIPNVKDFYVYADEIRIQREESEYFDIYNQLRVSNKLQLDTSDYDTSDYIEVNREKGKLEDQYSLYLKSKSKDTLVTFSELLAMGELQYSIDILEWLISYGNRSLQLEQLQQKYNSIVDVICIKYPSYKRSPIKWSFLFETDLDSLEDELATIRITQIHVGQQGRNSTISGTEEWSDDVTEIREALSKVRNSMEPIIQAENAKKAMKKYDSIRNAIDRMPSMPY